MLSLWMLAGTLLYTRLLDFRTYISDYPRKQTCKTKSTSRQVANYIQWTNDSQLTPWYDNQHVNVINTKAPAVPCPKPSGSHSTLQKTTSASLATHPHSRKSSSPASYSEDLGFKSRAVGYSELSMQGYFIADNELGIAPSR